MSELDIANIILSSVTIIINAGLWIVAFLNFRSLTKKDISTQQRYLAETVFKIVNSHQNIYLTIMKNNKYLEMLYLIPSQSDEKEIGNVLGTVIINHCWNIFIYGKNNLLDYDTLLGMENDISEIFLLPLIKWRWETVKKYYSEDFQDFICEVCEKGRRPSFN